ncbi:MAG TPA: succinate dehydrogenase, hydrophobic membrane anchor protein [Micropepsaceae bacterium]|jgi:succinate dehydrogenase / fumarate reductase membrane anchor subunit|nr:succinate dehydrogenase, hydrophobic membrane anchor protein [Micropepsaceae bacterium]
MSGDFRTPLATIEGLGSAKEGTSHFWQQRITAVALVPLSIWFAASALAYVGAEEGAVATFFAQPLNGILMFLFLFAALVHMRIGLQVIIEDYIHQEGLKVTLLMLNRFANVAIGVGVAYALIKIALSVH